MASTTGLIGAESGEYSEKIITRLGLPKGFFGRIERPGFVVGGLKDEVKRFVGGDCKVVLCASHDTASAVEGIDTGCDDLYLSSGTWSLLGAKIKKPITGEKSLRANFTNEGGVGYIRYLKNIMGLWIIQRLQKQTGLSFNEMEHAAAESGFTETFDVNAPVLTAPEDMRTAVLGLLGKESLPDADIINSVFYSLAQCYAKTVGEIEDITEKRYRALYITGGGAKNKYLNALTERFTKKRSSCFR